MLTTFISDGVSLGAGLCAMILQPNDEEQSNVEFNSFYLTWSLADGSSIVPLDFKATRLVSFEEGILVLGRLGKAVLFKNGTRNSEVINGPQDYGFLTDLRLIGSHLYAVGMARQAYQRISPNNWARIDLKLRDESIDNRRVTGFRSIDGTGEDEILAVGLDGEIWNWRGEMWRQIASPTNRVLEQTKALKPGTFYIAGQAGVILRGERDSWQVIEQDSTEQDFWGLEQFKSTIYLATATQLFRMNSRDELEEIQLPQASTSYHCRLRSGNGALWLFGATDSYWTEDGESWHKAQLRNDLSGGRSR